MLSGRFGCFDSHIQCIKKAYIHDLYFCLILEDDCIITDNFYKTLTECNNFIFECEKNKTNIDTIYLHNRGCVYLTKNLTTIFTEVNF